MKKPTITYDDFQKLEFLVGEVVNATNVEKSEKLLELTVNLGPEYGTVTILTGMAQFHKPEEFTGKKFIFIANLEPRKMMGKESQGMIFAADAGTPVLIPVDSSIPVGSTVR